jgi:hypothetical protein
MKEAPDVEGSQLLPTSPGVSEGPAKHGAREEHCLCVCSFVL